MTTKINWQTVEKKITQDDQNKWDQKVTANQLEVLDSGIMEVAKEEGGKETFPLSDLAKSQMCQKLGIPNNYYKRLPGKMKATVANYDLRRVTRNSFLLRGKGDWIRAFLSGNYVTYNNSQIIAEIVQGLLGKDEITVKSFILEETNMYLKILSEEIVDTTSGLKAGVMIGNSEVGMGSVSVEPFVYRLSCTNDLVVNQSKAFRHAHIHFRASELNRRMAEGISEGFKVAQLSMERFLKAREEPVPDPVETIRKLAKARKYSQKFADEVIGSFYQEPNNNRYGVINAFTNAAQKLSPLKRIEIERFGGSLLATKNWVKSFPTAVGHESYN